MSETTALSETTAMSETTALSKTTALSITTAAGNDVLSYNTLLHSRAFVLDCWHVYPTRNLIRHREHDNEHRQLEPRLMRLLCLLAASADAVVDRDEIITVLWPRVVVNENSLTRAVSDLRQALTPAGDKRTTLIQTIPKRGYRLTQTPASFNVPEYSAAKDAHADPAARSAYMATASHWVKRWTPSIAASFILVLALVVRVSNDGHNAALISPPNSNPSSTATSALIAQLPAQPVSIDGASTEPQPLYDSVIDDGGLAAVAAPYPITQLGSAPAWRNTLATDLNENADSAKNIRQSMLTPDGQLFAYVDYRDGISSLNLRPALTEAEPWVAFTTDEQIYHLQWSPLDAGILLTVGQSLDTNERSSYLRLMLLDLETLTLQELYRRELPTDAWLQNIGNLT